MASSTRTRAGGKSAARTTANGRAAANDPSSPGSTMSNAAAVAPAPPLPPAAPLRPGVVPQTFYNPTRIIYAEGAAGQVGPHAARLGATHVMVVSDPGVVRAGLTKPVVESITAAGLEASVYDA